MDNKNPKGVPAWIPFCLGFSFGALSVIAINLSLLISAIG